MKIEQLSVFLENKTGRLASITTTLGDMGINIRAMSLADTSDFGILRMIVSDTERAKKVLKDRGFTVSVIGVVAVEIPDKPGALGTLLEHIEKEELNVEYIYGMAGNTGGKAILILRFEDSDIAIDTLVANKVNVLDKGKIFSS